MKSKSLQLQSNKSKRSSKNDENNTKKVLLFYVLYLFHGNVSGVVPLVAGWRETKLNCTIGLLGGKNFTLGFFPFFELYQRDYHCYSKNCYPCSLWRLYTLQCQWSLTPAGQPIRSVGGWVRVGWGGGVSTECLFAVVLWMSSGSPTAQHFLLGSTWPSLSLAWKTDPPGLANHGSLPHTRHLQQGPTTTRPCCHPALSPTSHLSVLWHKDHFSWKM